MPKRTPLPTATTWFRSPRAKHVFTPEQGAKELAAAKARNHKPARGGPPRSTRDDKSGAGWGGAANSPGDGNQVQAPAHPEHAHNLPPEIRAAKALAKATRIEALVENLIIHAFDPEVAPPSRISATVAALNREEGLPVARRINTEIELGWRVGFSIGLASRERTGRDDDAARVGRPRWRARDACSRPGAQRRERVLGAYRDPLAMMERGAAPRDPYAWHDVARIIDYGNV